MTEIPEGLNRLKDDLIWAHYDLAQYKMLFLSGQIRTNLLLYVASHFFERLNQIYWDRFTLTIARMTDQYERGGNTNLSVHYLESILELLPQPDRLSVELKIGEIDEQAKKYKRHRNKNIAHRDFLAATITNTEPDRLRISEVERIYADIGICVNTFYQKIEDSSWCWEMVGPNNANSLCHFLKLGAIYEEIKRRRMDPAKDSDEELQSSFCEDHP